VALTMRAMVLERLEGNVAGSAPLRMAEVERPRPGKGEVLVRVSVCGVCHTELDEIEGRTPPPRLPVIPGHQVVGVVEEVGPGAASHHPGARVGIGWIHSACGSCAYCSGGRENLCPGFVATGRDVDGGYAEYLVTPESSACAVPPSLTDAEAAPLLCAGAVGYRALRLTGLSNGQELGLMGFGASAHLVLQMVRYLYPQSPVHVFARSVEERAFGLQLGANSAGDIDEPPPAPLRCIIDTTPAWRPVLAGLRHLDRGGRLVVNAIRKEDTDISAWEGLSYADHLWQEKELKSVANVTRQDIADGLRIAAEAGIHPTVAEYPLAQANDALAEIRSQHIRGAKVLRIAD
jgi:alcohol dehydrogenase, propanol-preferring